MARSQQGTSPKKKPAAKKPAEPDHEPPPDAGPEEGRPLTIRDQLPAWLDGLEDAAANEFGIIDSDDGPAPHPTLVLVAIMAMFGEQGQGMIVAATDRVLNECLILERNAR